MQVVQDRFSQAAALAEGSPEDAARAFELERASGVPAQAINQDIPGFEEDHKRQLRQQIVDNNPSVASFILAHPLHGQLVNDDVGNLDSYTRAYRRLAPGGSPAAEAIKGFGEGFGGEAPGEVYPRFIKDADQHPLVTSLLAPI